MNPTQNHLLERRLDEFEWSVRTGACLRNEELVTIADLVRKTEKAMRRIPNFGPKSLQEVKEFLVGLGLRLGMDMPKPRLVKLVGLGRATPRCCAHVNVSSVPTITRMGREEKAKRRGLPIDMCGEYANWTIDGDPYCYAHAGRRALQILEEQDGR